MSELLVGVADSDPRLGSKGGERLNLINVSVQHPFSAEGRRPGIRMGIHGGASW
jgi:hypothetical protein